MVSDEIKKSYKKLALLHHPDKVYIYLAREEGRKEREGGRKGGKKGRKGGRKGREGGTAEGKGGREERQKEMEGGYPIAVAASGETELIIAQASVTTLSLAFK